MYASIVVVGAGCLFQNILKCWRGRASKMEGKNIAMSNPMSLFLYIHNNDTYDADSSAKSLGRQVVAETSTNDTVGTVDTSNATPDDTELATVLFSLGVVDVSNTLAEIEASIVSGLNTFNLEERNVGVLVVLGTGETQDTALGVQTISSYIDRINQSIHPFYSYIHPSLINPYREFSAAMIRQG